MKILFILPRMVTGGVERVTLSLIKDLIVRGYHCELGLLKRNGDFLEEAQKIVSTYELAPNSLIQYIPNLSKLIQKSEPTHIVTSFHDVATLSWFGLKLCGSQAIWLHWVHNTHDKTVAPPGLLGAVKHRLFNLCASFNYKRANKIISVSEGVRNEILQIYKAPSNKVITIYNPVISNDCFPPCNEVSINKSYSLIIAVGRLTRQKGFDILVEAASKIPLPFRIEIWGEGPERKNLEKLIHKKNLYNSVFLMGHTFSVHEKIQSSDLFILPSRHEGLPTVLIEALACGANIIATDCPHGPREILDDGKFGTLVVPEDPEKLANAICIALKKNSKGKGKAHVLRAQDFSVQTATKKWLEALNSDFN
ncbi:glycosyltransferase [Microbulbifer echini]|uniref:Glycosyltransferase n=1 Tax=Microbulbifer echini TaxID=1529067 RepID=A0ABV4NNL9_9GAMM